VTMEDGGLRWRERNAVQSDLFPGYRTLGGGEFRNGGYRDAMLQAVDNLFGAVNHRQALASTGETALAVQRLCEQIRQP